VTQGPGTEESAWEGGGEGCTRSASALSSPQLTVATARALRRRVVTSRPRPRPHPGRGPGRGRCRGSGAAAADPGSGPGLARGFGCAHGPPRPLSQRRRRHGRRLRGSPAPPAPPPAAAGGAGASAEHGTPAPVPAVRTPARAGARREARQREVGARAQGKWLHHCGAVSVMPSVQKTLATRISHTPIHTAFWCHAFPTPRGSAWVAQMQ
jgi:hypothetical protein